MAGHPAEVILPCTGSDNHRYSSSQDSSAGKNGAGSMPIDWSTCYAWSCSASIWARVGRPALRSGRPRRDHM